MKDRIVLIDGVRTPFLRSGGAYMDLMSYQLGQYAIQALLERTGIDPGLVDYVVMGNVISNIKTENVARESAVMAGIPSSAPCHTVKQACISASQAIVSGAEKIWTGHARVVVAGGVDNTSDTPIGFRREMRKKLFRAQKLKGPADTLRFVGSIRPRDLLPERPAVAEFITGRTMGKDCELLAQSHGISRREQDELAARSHQLAAAARDAGFLPAETAKLHLPPDFEVLHADDGIRGDTTADKIAKLRPAFDRYAGTITAANASFLTDGAAAVLLMQESMAEELGLTPVAVLHDWTFTGQDLYEELLLGPAYAIAALLSRTGLRLQDMDVLEFHEAFAAQVLVNLKCLASDAFCRDKLGLDHAVGTVDMDKFNKWGGSLSIGHPFGATGARLLTTAANRLREEDGRYALVAACAAGAQGHAMILERWKA